MKKYICIHGHFYQPPRENAWLEAIEIQESAYPYHDWNKRITAECYATNGASRILDEDGRIAKISNNYNRLSFNFGPTLLTWLSDNAPDVYQAILDADKESMKRFGGHGSAMAQAYNHLIMPLANRRDKETQIKWGIRDFEHRFGRKPEGMWLPETAVDLETLDVLADQGILFTVLAPHQARRVRKIGGRGWMDVNGGKIDPTMAYRCVTPSGKMIRLFFYDGPVSQAVAFERLLSSGERFANRLAEGFDDSRQRSQIMHIATDGETYGHHHRRGDMALAYALDYIEHNGVAELINYGLFLEKHPPTHEVEIIENSSWSCVHGVERWRSDCGCNSGGRPEWGQQWRQPLRDALDWLRDRLAEIYSRDAVRYLRDPWAARDDYIDVVLDRSDENVDRFLANHAAQPLQPREIVEALEALEMQRQTMLMFTSCGWFFDELSGIETVQVIQYAGRAVQLASKTFKVDLEEPFLQRLEQAKSNIPEHRNGRVIYSKFVQPAMLGLRDVCAHYAVSSLFEEYRDETGIYCYDVKRNEYQTYCAGRAAMAAGWVTVRSRITREESELCFCVLHFGDQNLNCGVTLYPGAEEYSEMTKAVAGSFNHADFAQTIRDLDEHYGMSTYSLKTLFRDEQRKVADMILQNVLADAERAYRQLYEYHAPLMRFLNDAGMPQPKVLYIAAEFLLNADMKRMLAERELQRDAILSLMEESRQSGVPLDETTMEFELRHNMERLAEDLRENPEDPEAMDRLMAAVELADVLPFRVNLFKVQNMFYLTFRAIQGKWPPGAHSSDAEPILRRFQELEQKLSYFMPA